ncbi:sulfite exporter TauE/SafE family protein [Candidatus Poribacteria bacterium]|nr:sulfite exporter TauE/SafE family protein [Candidatus Poribacteria bacterium]
MVERSAKQRILLQMASFYVGVTKSGFAGGTGIVITPLMAMVLRPKESLGLALPLLFLSDIVNFGLYWGQWKWGVVAALLPGSALGIVFATRVLVRLSETWVKRVLGALALFFVPIQILRMTVWHDFTPVLTGSAMNLVAGFGIGFVTGIFSTMAHLGGIITTLYFLLVLPKENINVTMVGCATVIFFWINGIKLITYTRGQIINRDILRMVPPLLPMLAIGLLAGKWVNSLLGGVRVDWFVYIVLVIVSVMAWKLLWDARPKPKASEQPTSP